MSTDAEIAERVRLALQGVGRTVCPFCTASHEHSFVVRQDREIPTRFWYQCYRAACGARGHWSEAEGLTLRTWTEPRTGTDPHQDKEIVPPDVMSFLSKYRVSHRTLVREGVRYDSAEDEILMPLYNTFAGARRHVGWQARSLEGKRIRTSYFVEPHHQYTAVNTVGAMNGPILVVENPLSAYHLVEATRYKRAAVALLGHVLTPRTATSLFLTWREYIVLLDPDTWPSGVTRVLRAFEAAGASAEAKYLPKKPYALSEDEVRSLVT